MLLKKLNLRFEFDNALLEAKCDDTYRCIIDQLLESTEHKVLEPQAIETDSMQQGKESPLSAEAVLFRYITPKSILHYCRPLSEHITQFHQIIARLDKQILMDTLTMLPEVEVCVYLDVSSNEELDSRLSLVVPTLAENVFRYGILDGIPLERALTYIKPLTKDMRRLNQIISASSTTRVTELFENISDNELLAIVKSVADLNAVALSIHSDGVNDFFRKFPFKEWIKALDNHKTSRAGMFQTQGKMPAIKFNEQVLKNITHEQAIFVLKHIKIEDAELGLLDKYKICFFNDPAKVRSAFTNHQLIYLSAYYAEKAQESYDNHYESRVDELIYTIQERIKKGHFLLADYEELFAQNLIHGFLTSEILKSIESAQQTLQMHGTQSCCLVM